MAESTPSPEGMEDTRMLPIGEAARLLGVSVKTLRKWSNAGIVRPVRFPQSQHRRYTRAELERVRREVLGLEGT